MPKTGKLVYSPRTLKKAINDVQNGLPIKTTGKKYAIPRSTLQFRLKNKNCKDAFGPATILSTAEEKLLVQWICQLSRKGFPRKKDDVQRSVQEFLKQNPRKIPFPNDKPGNGWYKAFLRRHPIIAERTCEGVTAASASINESDIRKWFREIHEYLKEKQLLNILKDPSRVFNGDETSFQLCPTSGKVMAPKGNRNVYDVQKGNAKESITVMFTFSATGEVTPPMIIYPYQRIPRDISESIPDGWGVGRSDTGWMKAEVFYEYIANVFHPYLASKGTTFPVILFVDGHVTHLTYQLSGLCTELKIELIALYPNATRILQPADVSVFRSLKQGWKTAVRDWKNENAKGVVNKAVFATILNIVVEKYIKAESIVNGFKTCRLVPWNPDAIDYNKCLGDTIPKLQHIINKHTDVATNTTHPVVDMEKFVNIVGQETIQDFENIAERIEEHAGNEQFFILFRIWQELKGNVNIPRNIGDESEISIATPLESPGTRLESIKSNLKHGCASGLGEFLMWPDTPKRKGKRNTTRFPFVITSQRYKEMHKEKESQKMQIEKDKQERKEKKNGKKIPSNYAQKTA